MTDLDSRTPEFTIALRGYDRLQVDEYIDRLQALVREADERARNSEATRVFAEHSAVGARVSQIFELAETEARELSERVKGEINTERAEARREAREIVENAERVAEETTERTSRECNEMLQEFEHERDRLQAEAEQLELRKSAAVGELRRLYELIGAATGVFDVDAAMAGGDADAPPLPAPAPGAEPGPFDGEEDTTAVTRIMPAQQLDEGSLERDGGEQSDNGTAEFQQVRDGRGR